MARKKVPRIDPETIVTTIGVGRSTQKYSRGKPIFQQGAAADAVFYIQDGKVQVTVISEQGKEGVIGMLHAGESHRSLDAEAGGGRRGGTLSRTTRHRYSS